jgi:uncharacterized protein (TIGR02246 family)
MTDATQDLMQELGRLRDIEAIKQLKARYVRFVDTKDWEAFRELLTEDFRLESDAGTHEGRDAVVSMVSSALAGASTVHHALLPEISIVGPDTATGIWAMEDFITLGGDGALAFQGYGHYHEEYVRTDRGWRLRRIVGTRLRIDPIE